MKKLLFQIVCCALLACPAWANSYSTSFSGTENPLHDGASEGVVWTNGLATGLDWQDIQKTPGFAHGAVIAVNSQDDCTAVLTGTWTQNQTVQGTAVVNVLNGEIELRLNSTVTAHSNTGYEIDIVIGGGVYIVRWDGARGVNTLLAGPFAILDNSGSGPLVTGSKFKATNVSGVITVYEDIGSGFVSLGSAAADNTYTAGKPGIGTYMVSGAVTDAGWSAFSAFDDASSKTCTLSLTGAGPC